MTLDRAARFRDDRQVLMVSAGFTNLVAPAGYTIEQDTSVNGVITIRVTGAPAVPAPGSSPVTVAIGLILALVGIGVLLRGRLSA